MLAGVALGMYNTEESIKGFASSCFEYALQKVGQDWSLPGACEAGVLEIGLHSCFAVPMWC